MERFAPFAFVGMVLAFLAVAYQTADMFSERPTSSELMVSDRDWPLETRVVDTQECACPTVVSAYVLASWPALAVDPAWDGSI